MSACAGGTSIARPRGRYAHRAERLRDELLALLPTAVPLATLPAGDLSADRPSAHYRASTSDARLAIASDARARLVAGSPIRRGHIVWTETSAGPRRALVLHVGTEYLESSDRYVLRFRIVLQRANGQWGTKQRSTFPGFIARGYEQRAEANAEVM